MPELAEARRNFAGEVVEGEVEVAEGGEEGEGVGDDADECVLGEVEVDEAAAGGDGGGGEGGGDEVEGEVEGGEDRKSVV